MVASLWLPEVAVFFTGNSVLPPLVQGVAKGCGWFGSRPVVEGAPDRVRSRYQCHKGGPQEEDFGARITPIRPSPRPRGPHNHPHGRAGRDLGGVSGGPHKPS
jgi:hypothetical protein